MSNLRASGPQRPKGTVVVSGAKNSATRLLAAAMLTRGNVTLTNFPTTLVDCNHKARFMRNLGASVEFDDLRSVANICCSTLDSIVLDSYDYPIRTTYLLAAGQLHRSGIARIPYPGGCKLGDRKHDLHIMVWRALGCQVNELDDHIEIVGDLAGGEINFPISTVGGTENALLCAVVARGRSILNNAYVTPEIDNLIELLRLMGANIQMHGLSRIEVEGVEELRGGSVKIIPDRIEALTWMVFAAMTGGDILVENVPFTMMEVPLIHLRKSGLDYFANTNSVYVSAGNLPNNFLQPFEIACGTHPGIISDMQPFYVLLALHAIGRSLVIDYRYPERTAYVEQLAKIYRGALSWKTGKIDIEGNSSPAGAEVTSTDLRGSMALIMAAFAANGESTVHSVGLALRGYDKLEQKLRDLGLRFDLV